MDNITLGILCCVGGAISWGFSGACVEALFKNYVINPLWVASTRMLVAGIILCMGLFVQRGRRLLEPLCDRRSLLQLVSFAVFGLTLCQLAYLNAIRWSNAGTATVLQSLEVVLVAVFVCVTTRTKPSKRIMLCIVLALVGVWLLATGGDFRTMKLTPLGLFWGLFSAVGGANYSLIARAPMERWGSLPVTGLAMLIGGVLLCLGAQTFYVPAGLDLCALMLLASIIFIGTLGAFVLFMQGILLVGPVRAAVLACLEAVTAALFSALWLGSQFSPTDLVGFACILLTVFLLRK